MYTKVLAIITGFATLITFHFPFYKPIKRNFSKILSKKLPLRKREENFREIPSKGLGHGGLMTYLIEGYRL